MMVVPAIVAVTACVAPTAFSFHLPSIARYAPSTRANSHGKLSPLRSLPLQVKASARGEDNLWPWSVPTSETVRSDEERGDIVDEEERFFNSALDSVVKIYATHSGKKLAMRRSHRTSSSRTVLTPSKNPTSSFRGKSASKRRRRPPASCWTSRA